MEDTNLMGSIAPLYGEEKKYTKIAQYTVGGFLFCFVTYCLIIAIVYAVKYSHYQHIAGAFLLVLTCLQLLLALIFFKMSDQEEDKFKWNAIVCIFMVVAVGVILNIYVWTDVSSHTSCKEGETLVNGKCLSCPINSIIQVFGNGTASCYMCPVAPTQNCSNNTNDTMIAEKSALTTGDLNSAILGEGNDQPQKMQPIQTRQQSIDNNAEEEQKKKLANNVLRIDESSALPFKDRLIKTRSRNKRIQNAENHPTIN
eukprot:TRINITY_DN11274_c0_g1_i1.p1 TRINITY_DN11274_c0_g1~~TRINITY_DN11274_c0_g1_i1.p1  ORF type:complete len:277 (-),score=123.41 TRINITY_DN11274_c0_g1_i1:30-797(-)